MPTNRYFDPFAFSGSRYNVDYNIDTDTMEYVVNPEYNPARQPPVTQINMYYVFAEDNNFYKAYYINRRGDLDYILGGQILTEFYAALVQYNPAFSFYPTPGSAEYRTLENVFNPHVSPTTGYNPYATPRSYVPEVLYFYAEENYGCYAAIYRDNTSPLDLRDIGLTDLETFVREMLNRFPGYGVEPRIGSSEFSILSRTINTAAVGSLDPFEELDLDQELAISNDTVEDTMMRRRSRAAPANEFSFIIVYDTILNQFALEPPSLNTSLRPNHGIVWAREPFELSAIGLEQAYKAAHEYSSVSKQYTGADGWNVWPRKNSIPYRELECYINNTNVPNNSGISGFQALKTALREIKTNPTSSTAEEQIIKCMKYYMWRRHKVNAEPQHFTRSLNADTLNFIQKYTGAEFVQADNGPHYKIIHKSNAVMVRGDLENESLVHIVTKRLATSTAKTCAICSGIFSKNLVVYNDEKHYCHTCLDNTGYYVCRECPGNIHRRDIGCPNTRRKSFEYIYSYNTDVTRYIPQLFSEKKNASSKALRYGVELEVLVKEGVAFERAAYSCGKYLSKYALLKSDSSIGGGGFEIVTAPASLGFHRKTLWNEFFKTPSEMSTNGKTSAQMVQSWNTGVCGIHVHVTRAALTKLQLAKFVVFYHEDANAAFLSKIAGRLVGPGAHYCKTAKKKLRRNMETNDHHEAVTISSRNNGKTVEVRIFRGNATKHGIMRALEFVDATVKWCGETGADNLNYKDFLKWFDQPTVRSTYPDLWRHLIYLGYIATKHKSKGKKVLDVVPDTERVA